MSTTILADLLKQALLEKEKLDAESSNTTKSLTDTADLAVSTSTRQFLQAFSLRFPVEFWSDALEYFQ